MGQVDRIAHLAQLGNFAEYLSKEYQHYADLAHYATLRVNETLDHRVGTLDQSWWTLLMDECVAKRDALHQVIKNLRTLVNVRVTTRDPDWQKGMEVYIREFLTEGAEPNPQD